MKQQLQKLFYPKTIAVVGASDRPHSVGHAIMHNLLNDGFRGKVYPVNLKHKKIHSLPAFRTIKDLPEVVDLAIIATPAKTVANLIIDCGKKEIGAVIIISAGFKEVGDEGLEMYDQILRNARKYGIRIIGPNCLGIINTSINLNASFWHDPQPEKPWPLRGNEKMPLRNTGSTGKGMRRFQPPSNNCWESCFLSKKRKV